LTKIVAPFLLLLFSAKMGFCEVRVEIELIHGPQRSLLAPQEWSRVLGEAGFARTTIRSWRSGDQFGIENIGSERAKIYRVTALLSGETLILPSDKRFSRRDAPRIEAWLEQLKENGPDVVTAEKGMFGLTAGQLAAIEKETRVPVAISTNGKAVSRVVDRIAENLQGRLLVDTATRTKLDQQPPIRNEVMGLSTGTALAIILRSAGLSLLPRARRGRLEWMVIESRPQQEVWPIAWKSSQSPGRTVPALFETAQTQAVELPLRTALNELTAKMQVPLIFDDLRIAARSIDLDSSVKMRAGRLRYHSILNHLLRQVDLDYEVRVDENDKPILWISTLQGQ
jgi:hypothetical protein